ncbi:MAG: SLBB domain-containing protein, partial [Longimicrobiales bacterium]
GLNGTAYAGGFRFYRNGELVNIDLPAVLEDPGSGDDLVLLPGDSMFVPEYNPVVLVRGAVNSPGAVLFEEGQSLDYYIHGAGGFARHADEDRVFVEYANGLRRARREFLGVNLDPDPTPGSVVTVPLVAPDDRRDWTSIAGDIAQVTASLLALGVLISRL